MTPAPLKPNDDIDTILRDKMAEIVKLIEAIANEEPDTDLKLAELLDGEVETVRIAIIDKLREMLKERAAEKEQLLDKHLEAQKRIEGLFARSSIVLLASHSDALIKQFCNRTVRMEHGRMTQDMPLTKATAV